MMLICQRCGTAYMQTKSMSALVLTYCGVLCETADLGFSLLALERLERGTPRADAPLRGKTAVAAIDAGCSLAA